MSTDSFKTIRSRSSIETRVKGSRFIGEAIPIPDANRADAEIEEIRRREYDATHHCSAYRVGPSGDVFRYHDDGEPSGTAGPPILRQIDGRELTNVLVVVTRYYGGTKLGTGGLVRAYGEAADRALTEAGIITQVIFRRVNVSFEYDDTSPAMVTVERFNARIVDSSYAENTTLALDVPAGRVEAFVEAFVNALGGRGSVESRS